MININPEHIVPSEKRLLIKVQEKATKTVNGIELAGNEQNTAPTIGIVLRAGKNSIYKQDDIVIFRRYAVDEIRYNENGIEKTVWFIEDSDALGKMESAEEKDTRYNAIEEKKSRNLQDQEQNNASRPDRKKEGKKVK